MTPAITAALSFVTRNWKLLALGAAALAFGLILWGKNIEIRGLNARITAQEGQIATLNRDLGTCRGNVATLEAGIAGQNAALERVRADGAARVAGLEQALSTARISAQTAQQRAEAILARRPGADACADALAIIRGE